MTAASIDSKWVIDEASRGSDQRKLVCLREGNLPALKIPPPFSTNTHVLKLDEVENLLEALTRLCRRK